MISPTGSAASQLFIHNIYYIVIKKVIKSILVLVGLSIYHEGDRHLVGRLRDTLVFVFRVAIIDLFNHRVIPADICRILIITGSETAEYNTKNQYRFPNSEQRSCRCKQLSHPRLLHTRSGSLRPSSMYHLYQSFHKFY